jgi:hypothetical protein
MTADEFASNLTSGVEEYAVRGDEAGDVEALAWLLNGVQWPFGMGDDDYSRKQAEAILASDWLAARDAEQRRLGREEGAGAVFEAVERELLAPMVEAHDDPDEDINGQWGDGYGTAHREVIYDLRRFVDRHAAARAAAQQVSER